MGIGAEIIPKGASNLGQSLSRPPCDSSLYTREPLGRGCGLPRRPCGPPRNDNGFLSFRGAERRGNPSFLRWTGVRAAVPRAWPPPTKFRPEIWGVGQVVGPYGRSAEVPATGRCGHRPLRGDGEVPATTRDSGAQRSVRASGHEEWVGIGAKTIPKGGPPPRLPRQRLAKRKARG